MALISCDPDIMGLGDSMIYTRGPLSTSILFCSCR